MFIRVKVVTIVFLVMQPNVIGSIHPFDIPRIIVAAIKVSVMAMRTGNILIDSVPNVPLISQTVGRIKMAI